MQIPKLLPGAILEMKKPHPCSSRRFKLLRVGSICRIVCEGCGRDLDIERVKLEHAIKKITLPEENPQ